MTTSNETGVTIFFVADGLTLSRGGSIHSVNGFVARRGMTVLVDDALRQANTGRDGTCVFDLDAAAQERRFGKIMFLPGEPPEDFDPLVPGSFEHDQARANALREAAEIADPDEQRIALARVRERYGVHSEGRSRTLMEYQR
jgi:hypothetical protein